MGKYVMGLDNGGTSTKAALFDLDGREIAVAGRDTKMITPKSGYTERDMEELWQVPGGKNCLVNQREVHRDTHSFANALRSALREDPDIILVGELRDLETIRLALTAAETGHLVFGTLHTNSATKTIDRIIDVFPAAEKGMVRSMLSESLDAVISQTLLKKIGGGRIAAHEIMIATPPIRNLIREDKVAQMYSTIQTSAAYGMKTLDADLNNLVRRGLVTVDDARAKAKDPNTIG